MARGNWGGALDPNVFKVNLLFTMGASKCQTGFKLRDYGVQDNSAQDVAGTVAGVLVTGFKFMLSARDSWLGVDVIKMGTEEGGWDATGAGAGTNGVAANTELPNFICAAVTLKSEIRKRYGQGRMFLPLVDEVELDGNTVNAAGLSAVNAIITLITDNFTGSGLTHDLLLVNAHPALAARGAPGAPGYRAAIPASWYDVVSLRVNSLATSLRSRKAGVGS